MHETVPPAAISRVPIASPISAGGVVMLRLIVGTVMLAPLLGTLWLIALWFVDGVATASIVALVLAYVFGMLGITIGFHRYFAHKSFETSAAMRLAFVVLGSMSAQGSLLYWVSTHRRHHQYSDTEHDPHSPHFDRGGRLGRLTGLWHSHLGWMFDREMTSAIRFAPDILKDRRIFAVQRRYGLWVLIGLFLPPLIGLAFTRDPGTLLQIFLAAGPMRFLLVHHASWAVGSISHLYGARPFRTNDHSANNFWVALFAFGEGLQNNHHAFPRAAVHGFRRTEPDFSGLVLRGMQAVGLVRNLHRPSDRAKRSKLA